MQATSQGSGRGELRLGDRLVAAGVLDAAGLARALEAQRESGAWFGDVVVDLSLVSEDDLLRVLSADYGTRYVPSFRLATLTITQRTLARVPAEVAERLQVVPLAFDDASTLHLLTVLPPAPEAVESIARAAEAAAVTLHIGTRKAVDAMVRRHYRADAYAFAYLPHALKAVEEDALELDLSGDVDQLRAELARIRSAESLRLRLAGVREITELPGRLAAALLDVLPAAAAATVVIEGGGTASRGPDGRAPTAADASLLATGAGEIAPGGSVMSVPLVYIGERVGAAHLAAHERFVGAHLETLRALAVSAGEAVQACRDIVAARREEAARTHLSRFLSPALTDMAVRGAIDVSADGSQRTATILVATLGGVQAPAESENPAWALEKLNNLYEAMASAIHEEGGTLDRLGPRGVSAVFGAPVPHADDAARALRAGARIASLPLDGPLRVGIGIARGDILFGSLGPPRRRDLTAFGPAVDLASRLSTGAGPSEVLLTRATSQAIEGRTFEPRPLPQRAEELPLAVVRWVPGT